MIDENILIDKLNKRKAGYLDEYPDRIHSLEVETVNEFIHLIELEAKEQSKKREEEISVDCGIMCYLNLD